MPALPRRGRSAKADALLVGVALLAVLGGAAVLKFGGDRTRVVTTESTTEGTIGSATTFASVQLTAASATAVLVGIATPGAVVRVRDRQTVADASGGWRITVDLVPGINHFQAVATGPSGLQVATNFTVIYTPTATTDAVATETTSPTPATPATATTTATTAATTRPATPTTRKTTATTVTTEPDTTPDTTVPDTTPSFTAAPVSTTPKPTTTTTTPKTTVPVTTVPVTTTPVTTTPVTTTTPKPTTTTTTPKPTTTTTTPKPTTTACNGQCP